MCIVLMQDSRFNPNPQFLYTGLLMNPGTAYAGLLIDLIKPMQDDKA